MSFQIFHSSNKRSHLCLVGKRKPQNYNNSKRKTFCSLGKFYYFKSCTCLKVGAPRTFEYWELLCVVLHLSRGDLTSQFLSAPHHSVYESDVEGSHFGIQGMELTAYGSSQILSLIFLYLGL